MQKNIVNLSETNDQKQHSLLTRKSASGQALWRSQADIIGQQTSYLPYKVKHEDHKSLHFDGIGWIKSDLPARLWCWYALFYQLRLTRMNQMKRIPCWRNSGFQSLQMPDRKNIYHLTSLISHHAS